MSAASEQFKYSFVGDLEGLRRQAKQAQEIFTDLQRMVNKGITIGGGNIDFGAKPEQLNAQSRMMNALTNSKREARLEEEKLNNQIAKSQANIARYAANIKGGTSELEMFGSALRRSAVWFSAAFAVHGASRLIKETLDLASAFQDTVKTLTVFGDEGEAVYTSLAQAGYKAAIATGRSFKDASIVMGEWVRQGYSANDIASMMQTSLIGLNVADMSQKEIVKTLTAEMKAFNIPASESITILDRLVAVSKRFSIDTAELSTGIRRFSGVSALSNVTMEQSLGLMSAIQEMSQAAPERIGRSLATILTRLKKNAEGITELTGVPILDKQAQSYRSLWDVLQDLTTIWPRLSDVAKNSLADMAAGQSFISLFINLMENFKTAQISEIEALSSTGLAFRSNQIIVDSFSRAVEQLKTQFQSLLGTQTGLLHFVTTSVHGLRAMLNQMAMIPEQVGLIGSSLMTLGGGALAFAGHPVIGGAMALSGLVSGISYAVGKFRLPDVREMSAQYKDMINNQVDAAQSTEKLADKYISLYEKTNRTKDITELLHLTRQKLDMLNPSLLSGETNLAKVYDKIKDSLSGLKAETQAAFESRKQYLLLEKEISLSNARMKIYEARRNLPQTYQGMSEEQLGSEASKEFEKQKNLLLQAQDLLVNIQKLELISQKAKQDMNLLTSDELKMLKEQVPALQQKVKELGVGKDIQERALDIRNKNIRGEAETGQISMDPQYQALLKFELMRLDLTQKINKLSSGEKLSLQEQAQLANDIQIATDFRFRNSLTGVQQEIAKNSALSKVLGDVSLTYKEIQTLQQDQSMLRNSRMAIDDEAQDSRPGPTGGEKEKINYEKQINDELQRQQLVWERLYISANGIAETELNRVQMASDIYSKSVDFLAIQAQIAENDEKRKAAEKMMLEYGPESVKYANLMLDKEKARLALVEEGKKKLQERLKAEADVHEQAQKQFDKARKSEMSRWEESATWNDKVMKMRVESAQSETGMKSAFERQMIEVSGGPVVAAKFDYDQAKAEFDRLSKMPQAGQTLLDTENARLRMIQKEYDLKIATYNAEQDYNLEMKNIEESRFNTKNQYIRLLYGEVAVAEAIVQRRKGEYDASLKLENNQENSIKKAQALEAYQAAKADRDIADMMARRQAMADEANLVSEIAKIKQDNEARLVEIYGGREAMLKKEIRDLDLEITMNTLIANSKEKQLEIDKQRAFMASKQIELTELQYQKEMNLLSSVISLAGVQAANMIRGTFSASDMVGGIAQIGAGLFSESNPLLSMAINTGGQIFSALFDSFSDDSDKIDTALQNNTTALDRNTMTLEKVWQSNIGVSSSFIMPAGISKLGQIPYGYGGRYMGGTTSNKYETLGPINITIDAKGADAKAVAREVEFIIDRKFNIETQRGYVARKY